MAAAKAALRLSVDIGGRVASARGAFGRAGAGTIDGAFAAAAQIRGQRGNNHGVRAILAVFQRPLLDGAVDQAEVVNASILASRFTSFDEVRDGNRGQKTDDCNHDHDFNEREARLA